MTTDIGGGVTATSSTKSLKHVFYARLSELLTAGGFDRHIGALCKPFIADAADLEWWTNQPSSYFRMLIVGYLEGIESEQELCWHIEDSRSFREFVSLEASSVAPDPATLMQIRQRLMPLIHSEAFDAFMRIVDKTGIVEGRVEGFGPATLNADRTLSAIVQRVQTREHHAYWKRLTKTPGTARPPKSSLPPPGRGSSERQQRKTSPSLEELEPFTLWLEDLSLAQACFAELRANGVTDFKAYFDEHESPAVDHVVRACIYGRGPASVRAYLNAMPWPGGRELPQQLSADTTLACKAIAVALAEGKRQLAVEVPMLDAQGNPTIAYVQLAVQPGFEATLESVLVAFTDITVRKRLQQTLQPNDAHLETALRLNHVGVWEWDIASDVSSWSDAMYAIYGIGREEFTGRHRDYLEFTYPDDREIQRESVRQSFADFVKASHSFHPSADASTAFKDFRIRRKDGTLRWVRGGAVEVVDDQGSPVKMQGVLWDVTESKQAEIALRESEERFRNIVEQATVPVVVTAFDGEILYANDTALAHFGVDRDDLSRLRAVEVWQDRERRNHAASILAEVGELRNFEAQFLVGPQREPRSVLVSARVIEFDGRNVILSFHQPLPDTRATQERLEAVQAEMATLETRLQATLSEQRELELALQTARAQHAEAEQRVIASESAVAEQLVAMRQSADTEMRAERQRTDELIEARNRELQTLHRILRAVEDVPATLLRVACDALSQALAFPFAVAGMLSADRGGLNIVAECLAEGAPSCVGIQVDLASGGLLDVFSEHPHPLWIESAAEDERAAVLRALPGGGALSSALILPLVAHESLLGVLVLGAAGTAQLGADSMSLAFNVAGLTGNCLSISRKAVQHEVLKSKVQQFTETVTLLQLE
jgi:transposase